ncbi:cation transporter [Rathayibacter sp. VKM Ac-2804]|uniref:cation transporter n=1 Tax=Rathayibacter sp. VKM Ac-2804 TaxID=2609257 RepID=UPI00132F337F|nr:cation transporter [Rathayibacter sp. VKM Ac-2804]QHF22881.1 cation transporter [Rathayibacter sp. VKM Ac-2804]
MSQRRAGHPPRFGRTELPDEQRRALRDATRLEWGTLAFLAVTTTLVFLVLGSSQAMRTAWIEDLLSFLPPIAFLIATRVIRRPPTEKHPYGLHRATAIAHLVAAVSLLVTGGYLLVDSALTLVTAEHPTIGGVQLFGTTIWLGWLMIAVLALTVVPPVLFGRAKLTRAEILHDKVLYADADMNKADWQTAAAAILGILGIGIGWWWADSVAAILIAASITWDGLRNLRSAVSGLIDTRARTYDDSAVHPLADDIDHFLRQQDWISDARSRLRDQGHVFHVEAFIVPREPDHLSVKRLEETRLACSRLDWKVQDLVLVPV